MGTCLLPAPETPKEAMTEAQAVEQLPDTSGLSCVLSSGSTSSVQTVKPLQGLRSTHWTERPHWAIVEQGPWGKQIMEGYEKPLDAFK